MGKFIAEKTVKMMLKGGVEVKITKVGILGLTFKENCPDLRNSKVIDIIDELKSYGVQTMVHDPLVSSQQASTYANIELADFQDFLQTLKPNGCIIDVKSMLDLEEMEKKECNFWRL